jgi:hypothetical protein
MWGKGYKENEVADMLDALARERESFTDGVNNFIARQIHNKWEIDFTYRKCTGNKLHLKRGGIRKFSRISGVQAWMEKMRITSYTVQF